MIEIIDYGGDLGFHVALGKAYAVAGAHLKVLYCASACLLTLAQVPKANICFSPSAWVGYHTPAQHRDEIGRCCVEDANTMRWVRGRDLIAKEYRRC